MMPSAYSLFHPLELLISGGRITARVKIPIEKDRCFSSRG
ncbi:hypothetical protein DCCM_1000 [Desulfocucumis palustris]|uniref:Uncharacterized protein n=1 Tax=Desulfocucumis palustris TaxID=1898651 RepID=A0A2L2XA26_9FIRM|nr:hypothetical protein DCCM_1000 [Desulfocucumis palustris]